MSVKPQLPTLAYLLPEVLMADLGGPSPLKPVKSYWVPTIVPQHL